MYKTNIISYILCREIGNLKILIKGKKIIVLSRPDF